MSLVNSNSLILAAGGDYQISRSVRLRNSASAYFSRTYATSPTNNKINTFSGWVKRGTLGTLGYIFTAYDGTSALAAGIWFQNDKLWAEYGGPSGSGRITTTQVFRDPSAWYHIVLAIDTTQATASNRVKLYINGVQVTAFDTATNPTLNLATAFTYPNSNNRVGANWDNSGPFDGYLTEINFIDGQQLTPSSFGETNPVTGVWQPKKYTGTYGTNGFFLTFQDNSAATAAAIGKDYSGNGNNWTPNNISVTAGSTYDSMLDVPTAYADGGNGRGNYCVLNPLAYSFYTTRTSTSSGNLDFSDSTSTNTGVLGTTLVSSGKWYFEMLSSGTGVFSVGLKNPASSTEYSFYRNNGAYSSSFGGAGTFGYSSWTSGDVISVAWDEDSGKIWYAKNGVWQSGSPSAGTSPTNTFTPGIPLVSDINTDNSAGTKAGSFNFGQRPFTYTPPTGFKALNTGNLPEPTIVQGNKWMDATLWTGNGSTQTITNSGSMQPDLVWLKTRNTVSSNLLYDTQRGALKYLSSNQTASEATLANSLTAFNSNGFALGSDGNVNGSGTTFVGWQWQAGKGTTSTNTNGTITSTVSVSTTAGFSIVTYTGTGVTGTVGHGLGQAPSMMIFKSRSYAGSDWDVYHASTGNTGRLFLNTTAAFQTVDVWNNTSPTSTVFTINGSRSDVNSNTETYVAYCFAPVAGFSAFASYTGNGSTDGPFVYLGFRPEFVMIKRSSDGTNNWEVRDSARDTYNTADDRLFPNSSAAEDANNEGVDFLANGFKIRNAGSGCNASSATYIYAAFAENPFKYALAR
jgi:hypothetical protein